MLDLSYFQNSGNVNTQTFTNAGSWVTWVKPRGAKHVNIFCMGSGGGGGGGFRAAAGGRSGGAGGGAGGIVRTQFQASILPDLLYIYTGLGGVGGTGGAAGIVTAGGNGEKSYVCLTPSTASSSNIVVTSGNVSARGGSAGSTVTVTGGAGETIATTANAIFLNLGTFIAAVGILGSNSSANTTTTITFINFPGAGGASTGTGGTVTGAGPFASLPGGTNGSGATNAIPGRNGYMLTKPILGFMGGSGGGGIQAGGTGTGGKGGDGSYGSGGGGGGSSETNTPGNGGKGGDGLVIITTSF